jgi:hypothetical protein
MSLAVPKAGRAGRLSTPWNADPLGDEWRGGITLFVDFENRKQDKEGERR